MDNRRTCERTARKPGAAGHRFGSWGWLPFLAALAGGATGCGTTRVTNTQRSATEQLLVSNAIDQSVSRLDFRALAGKSVFLDAQYLGTGVDQGYAASTLRQHLLACGCLLQEERRQATYVVEARSGAIGTDLHQVLLGVPQMNLPGVLPGQPTMVPEIPFSKKTDQKGVAKLAVFAYNRKTGRPVWQSGVVQSEGTSKDTWVLGAGPFRRGTIGEATEIAGQQVAIPLLSGKEDVAEDSAPVMAVTRPATWREPAERPNPVRMVGTTSAEPPSKSEPVKAGPAASGPSVEAVGAGSPLGAGAKTPDTAGATTGAHLDLSPLAGFKFGRPASGGAAGEPR